MRKPDRKKSVNVLWFLPPMWLVAFGIAFVRGHVIRGMEPERWLMGGLGAMAFVTVGFLIVEIHRRDSERRK